MMDLLFLVCALWFAYFLINHAEMFDRLRQAAMPALPGWIRYVLECAICFSFWTLTALSLFVGYTPLIFMCPPCVLFTDLAFRRLKGNK